MGILPGKISPWICYFHFVLSIRVIGNWLYAVASKIQVVKFSSFLIVSNLGHGYNDGNQCCIIVRKVNRSAKLCNFIGAQNFPVTLHNFTRIRGGNPPICGEFIYNCMNTVQSSPWKDGLLQHLYLSSPLQLMTPSVGQHTLVLSMSLPPSQSVSLDMGFQMALEHFDPMAQV